MDRVVGHRHGWRFDRWDALITLGLIVFVAVIFWTFLLPPRMADPLDYFYAAWQLDEAQPTHRHLRVGLIWPTRLAIELFGYSELSYYAVPFAAATLFVLGTWLTGRLLLGRWVGGLAAVLAVYHGSVLRNLTELVPDYFGAALFAIGIALLLWCWRSQRMVEKPLRPGTVVILGSAGLAFGWSYLVREYVVFLFPLVPLVLVATGGRRLSLLPVALAGFSCWVAELAWGLARHGDALVRLHAVASPRSETRFIETEVLGILNQLPHLLLKQPGGWLLVVLFGLGVAFSVTRSLCGDRRWRILALWLIGGWLFFTTVALFPILFLEEGTVYLRMHKFRYWALILPPLLVAGLGGLDHLIRQGAHLVFPRRAPQVTNLAIGVTVVLIMANATVGVADVLRWQHLVRNGGGNDYVEFREFIRGVDEPKALVLIEHGGKYRSATRSIPIYLKEWHGLDRIWRGTTSVASSGVWGGNGTAAAGTKLDDVIEQQGHKLVVVDLARTATGKPDRRKRGWDTPGLLHYLDAHGEEVFQSSTGVVRVYRLKAPGERS